MLVVHWSPVKNTRRILRTGIRKSPEGLFCFPLTGLATTVGIKHPFETPLLGLTAKRPVYGQPIREVGRQPAPWNAAPNDMGRGIQHRSAPKPARNNAHPVIQRRREPTPIPHPTLAALKVNARPSLTATHRSTTRRVPVAGSRCSAVGVPMMCASLRRFCCALSLCVSAVLGSCAASSLALERAQAITMLGESIALAADSAQRAATLQEHRLRADRHGQQAALASHSEAQAIAWASPTRYSVCILPLGPLDAAHSEAAAHGIASRFGFSVHQLPEVALPRIAWTAARNRYRADVLIEWLLGDARPLWDGTCNSVVALTAVDVSATVREHRDWGVFGLARVGGQAAVASIFRLAGDQPSPEHLRLRLSRVVEHEVGHLLGLRHEEGEECMMISAEGSIAALDRPRVVLCEPSRTYIEERYGFRLPRPAASSQ
jgi:predicted Zn-dependent protease